MSWQRYIWVHRKCKHSIAYFQLISVVSTCWVVRHVTDLSYFATWQRSIWISPKARGDWYSPCLSQCLPASRNGHGQCRVQVHRKPRLGTKFTAFLNFFLLTACLNLTHQEYMYSINIVQKTTLTWPYCLLLHSRYFPLGANCFRYFLVLCNAT
jgi:hypothetical protein